MIWENEVIEGSAMSIYSKRFKDLMKDNNYYFSCTLYGNSTQKAKVKIKLFKIFKKIKQGPITLIDPRSIMIHDKYLGQIYKVYPIATNFHKCIIICPYCGRLHVHSAIAGHRNSHCKKQKTKGYIIDMNELQFDRECILMKGM